MTITKNLSSSANRVCKLDALSNGAIESFRKSHKFDIRQHVWVYDESHYPCFYKAVIIDALIAKPKYAICYLDVMDNEEVVAYKENIVDEVNIFPALDDCIKSIKNKPIFSPKSLKMYSINICIVESKYTNLCELIEDYLYQKPCLYL